MPFLIQYLVMEKIAGFNATYRGAINHFLLFMAVGCLSHNLPRPFVDSCKVKAFMMYFTQYCSEMKSGGQWIKVVVLNRWLGGPSAWSGRAAAATSLRIKPRVLSTRVPAASRASFVKTDSLLKIQLCKLKHWGFWNTFSPCLFVTSLVDSLQQEPDPLWQQMCTNKESAAQIATVCCSLSPNRFIALE